MGAALRDGYYRLCGRKKSPAELLDLEEVPKTEMIGEYRFFALQRLVNQAWAKVTLTERMDGSLMNFLAQRTSH